MGAAGRRQRLGHLPRRPGAEHRLRRGDHQYHEAVEDAGTKSNFGYSKAVYLDEDNDKAIEEGREPLLNFISFNVSPMDSLPRTTPEEKQRLIEAGYEFYAGEDFPRTRDLSDEQLLDLEIVYAGSPEKVGRQLVDLWDQFRFDEFLLIGHYGGTARWQAMKTQEPSARRCARCSTRRRRRARAGAPWRPPPEPPRRASCLRQHHRVRSHPLSTVHDFVNFAAEGTSNSAPAAGTSDSRARSHSTQEEFR